MPLRPLYTLLALIIIHLCVCLPVGVAVAQQEKRWLKQHITTLSATSMHGRGYVSKGGEKAAGYIRRKFQEMGLLSLTPDSSYYQLYNFRINAFPGAMSLTLNKKLLTPGVDYIVHASSKPFTTTRLKVKTIDLGKIRDTAAWYALRNTIQPNAAYLLKNSDTLQKYGELKGMRAFGKALPPAFYIVPQHGKLTWFASTDTMAGTLVYVEDTVMPRRVKRLAAAIESKYMSYRAQNVLAYVPGTEVPDSFVVFTAHYDHLGMMGRNTTFPGAHDNASGTAAMLYLAQWVAAHPQRYSVAFMAFSGEEAGLLGSSYYVKNPLFPLGNIRALINLDMTGDATNGITVVNANANEGLYNILSGINTQKGYLPAINKRDQAANSDHYPFSQAGVPAIFIYGNGTKPYYHDVFDKANELSLEHIDHMLQLLTEALPTLQ